MIIGETVTEKYNIFLCNETVTKIFFPQEFPAQEFSLKKQLQKKYNILPFFFEIAEYLCSKEHYNKRPITKSLASLIRYHLSKVRGACDILLHCIKKEAKTMAGVEESK